MGVRRFVALERIGIDQQNRAMVKQAQYIGMAIHSPKDLAEFAKTLFDG